MTTCTDFVIASMRSTILWFMTTICRVFGLRMRSSAITASKSGSALT
jgi:hypothetical protein